MVPIGACVGVCGYNTDNNNTSSSDYSDIICYRLGLYRRGFKTCDVTYHDYIYPYKTKLNYDGTPHRKINLCKLFVYSGKNTR